MKRNIYTCKVEFELNDAMELRAEIEEVKWLLIREREKRIEKVWMDDELETATKIFEQKQIREDYQEYIGRLNQIGRLLQKYEI